MTATLPTPPGPDPAAHLSREVLADDARDYWTLRDLIIDKLNPPDSDFAEIHIMCTAIEDATALIEAIPCVCTEAAASGEDDPCPRCQVLGRTADVREER
jgi:hypothetical protein